MTDYAFDLELLDDLVTAGWLRRGRHPEADLWIYNYTDRTQYENHWTPETLACRGLILDAAGEVVARPFPKFFNHGTPQAGPIPDGRYVVTEKLDGSLGIYYRLGDEDFIATRGSFTSDQAVAGTTMLREQDLEPQPGTTPLFEIVYPENRIVVDYGDRRELVLLAAINHADGSAARLPRWSGRTVQHYGGHAIDRLLDVDQTNREGYVLTWENGHRRKIKFDEYVRLHRVVTGINARAVWESMRDGDDLGGLLEGVPDEIYDWVTKTRAGLLAAFNDEAERALVVWNAMPDSATTRAQVAEYFKASQANLAVLFRMLDGKPYDDLIWKAIKPAAGVYPSASRSGREVQR